MLPLLLACASADKAALDTDTDTGPARHVLLVILDDAGVDTVRAYGDGGDQPYAQMPTLQSVCREGTLFERAWSAPSCSPTRAAMLTGRHGRRHGVGAAIRDNSTYLPLDEQTLPELLSGIPSANIGKWHLGTVDALGGALAPNTHGWPHFAGHLDGALEAYDGWERTADGSTERVTDYATTRSVDDAIAWLSAQDAAAPWLVWLAFAAPHTPLHVPPEDLHQQDGLVDDEDAITEDPGPYFRASLEALDAELARLLAWAKDNGHGPLDVIIIGDNGTPRQTISAPYSPRHAKNTLYEGGVHVPLCIQGPDVRRGQRSDALVHAVDIFPTIAELFGATPAAEIDGRSLVPLLDGSAASVRDWNYTEHFGAFQADARDGSAARGDRFKLIRAEGVEELYDLDADPNEQDDLLLAPLSEEAQAAYEVLRGHLLE